MNEKTHSACCAESTAPTKAGETACCNPEASDCCSPAGEKKSSHVIERDELHSAPANEGPCCTPR